MTRQFFTILCFLFSVVIVEAAEVSSHMTTFLVQVTRKQEILKRDGAFIANCILAAKPGDAISVITTNGSEDILSYVVEEKQTNRIKLKQAQNQAIATLGAFFTRLFKEPPPQMSANDFAGSIALVMERFNTASPYKRHSLVVLGSGLQVSGVIDFRGAYPNAAWVLHPHSPFSAISRHTADAKVDCLFLHQRGDFVNAYHKHQIEYFYSLLFWHKKVRLIGFTGDHQVASQILRRGFDPSRRSLKRKEGSEPPDMTGELELIEVGRLAPADQ